SAGEFAAHHELKREQVARDAEAQLSSLQEGIEHRHALGASTERGDRRSFALYVREIEESKARKRIESEDRRLRDSQRREVALRREREAILAGTAEPVQASAISTPAVAAASPENDGEPARQRGTPTAGEEQSALIASLGDLTQYS